MKKLISLFLLSALTVSTVLAGTTRPEGLKLQVDTMRLEVPARFDCMIEEITEDFGDDKSTFLYVLKMNVKAYWDIREADYSDDIIAEALSDFPCDFSTALYVIKMNTSANSELDSLLN